MPITSTMSCHTGNNACCRHLQFGSWLPYVFVLAALLPILLLRDFSYTNELRYLSIADEALHNGTFFTFYNHGEIYADKPPLYFWWIMLGRWLFGTHCMFFLSLCSLLSAFVVTRTMERWAASEILPEYRSSGILMMLSCGLFLGLAIFVRMDMLMCMFIVLAMRTFYRMSHEEGNHRLNTWLFPVYVFLGVFSKGPVAFLIPLACSFVYLLVSRRIRTFGRYWGWKTWGILLALCALWFGAVYWEGGKEYLNNLLFHQTIDRAVDSFHHKEPFYYYFISIWYSLLPWSLLIIGVVVMSVCRKRLDSELQRFFLTVFVTTFVMLSFVSSKIEIYLVPAFPFLLYLAVIRLSSSLWNRWEALFLAVTAAAFVMAAPVVIALAISDGSSFWNNGFIYAAAGILTLAGIMALYYLYGRKTISKTINIIAVALFAALFAGGWALPELNNTFGYGGVCRKAIELAEDENVSGYNVLSLSRAENMDVYLGEDINYVSLEDLVAGKLQNTVLMFKVKNMAEIRKIYPENKVCVVGRYAAMVL